MMSNIVIAAAAVVDDAEIDDHPELVCHWMRTPSDSINWMRESLWIDTLRVDDANAGPIEFRKSALFEKSANEMLQKLN